MTPLERTQELLQNFVDLPDSFPLVQVNYVKTQTDGTHLIGVTADRRVRHIGVIWAELE